jgi:cyclopropane-fatty-acyl-phospholipid synthase
VSVCVVREGIRYLLSQRASEQSLSLDELQRKKTEFVKDLKDLPIAIETDKANEQHYEVS